MYSEDFTDDLSNVVLNVHRRSVEATNRLRNHPLTRAYLEAGVRILRREVDTAHPGVDDDRFLRPLATLTRETVIAEVADGPPELPRHGTVGSFRDRWNFFPEYVADVARYTLREHRMQEDQRLAEDAMTALSGGHFTGAIHEIAYRRMLVDIKAATSRFRYSAVALAAQDPRLHDAMASVYAGVTDIWEKMIDGLLSARGLALRPGVSARDLATMLTAINEGLTVRIASDPSNALLDHERRRGLLGTAALGLFVGCVDTGDHGTLEELAERIAGAG
jgi:hypothetical protein